MKKQLLTFSFLLMAMHWAAANTTDSLYVKKIADTLASKSFLGRGYIDNGMQKAAAFIEAEMSKLGLQTNKQKLQYPVNTFPDSVSLTINGQQLRPGIDFLTGPESRSLKAGGGLQKIDSVTWINTAHNVLLKLVDKLTWSVSQQQANYTSFQVLKSVVDRPKDFSCNVAAKFVSSFKCENVMGVIKGTTNPDSTVVFTAHYDHLGAMGKQAWFPGANDNAGGVALMLGMAKRFVQSPPPYSVVFIAFAGEEAGLVGSKFFVDLPMINLKKIKFLLNLDLMANGEEGITVVNATEFPQQFATLQAINKEQNLLTTISSRGKAANSDHYWFTEAGVPSFFIYTLGARKAYHDVDDVAATLPWSELNDLETLLMSFVQKL